MTFNKNQVRKLWKYLFSGEKFCDIIYAMRQTKLDVHNLTRISLCVALICVTSYLVIPLPFTPVVISLHSIVINLVGLMLKPKHVALTIGTYLLMGLIGLPVFAAGTAGVAKLLGPTGGFYFGFFFGALAISLLKGTKSNLKRYTERAIYFCLRV